MVEWYWFWKYKDNGEGSQLSWCVEYWNESCEYITEDVSIIEPDINNSIATGECDSNNRCSSNSINFSSQEGNKNIWHYFGLEKQNEMVVKRKTSFNALVSKSFWDYAERNYVTGWKNTSSKKLQNVAYYQKMTKSTMTDIVISQY